MSLGHPRHGRAEIVGSKHTFGASSAISSKTAPPLLREGSPGAPVRHASDRSRLDPQNRLGKSIRGVISPRRVDIRGCISQAIATTTRTHLSRGSGTKMQATFDNSTNLLNSNIRAAHDDSKIYTVRTTSTFLRGRKLTVLIDTNPLVGNAIVGAIHWQDRLLEVHGERRKWKGLKRREKKFFGR